LATTRDGFITLGASIALMSEVDLDLKLVWSILALRFDPPPGRQVVGVIRISTTPVSSECLVLFSVALSTMPTPLFMAFSAVKPLSFPVPWFETPPRQPAKEHPWCLSASSENLIARNYIAKNDISIPGACALVQYVVDSGSGSLSLFGCV
jgi:hypothetical protein